MPQLRLLLIVCIAALMACKGSEPSAPQSPEPPAASASEVNISLPDPMGTPIADYVVALLEDTRGHIWIGTVGEGLAHYDGQHLTYMTTVDGLLGNTVVSIVEDGEGQIWLGYHAGASRFDGAQFTHFAVAEGLTGPGCKIFVDRAGKIWAHSNQGVFRFQGDHFEAFDLPVPELPSYPYKWELGKVWAMMEDRQGNLWFGRDGYGATRYDGSGFTHFTQADGLPSNQVASIAEDPAGNIWLGTLSRDFPAFEPEGGLARYDGQRISTFLELPGLHHNDIYHVWPDPTGPIWISALQTGAYRHDEQGFQMFKDSDRPDRAEPFAIQSMLRDRQGQLWCGFTGGLFRFDGEQFIHVSRQALGG